MNIYILKVVDLLNQASLMLKDTDKTANLRQVGGTLMNFVIG